MFFSFTSEQGAKVLLIMMVCAISPRGTNQLPVGEGYGFLLYPVFVPYRPHTMSRSATTTENTPKNTNLQTDNTKSAAQSVTKSSNANSGLLQPGPALGPTPSPVIEPSDSPALQGQMSPFLPLNLPVQVYTLVQQAGTANSESSEEGGGTQVIYMLPINMASNMGLNEGPVPNPDLGNLHVQTSPSPPVSVAHPHAQAQLAQTVGTEQSRQRAVVERNDHQEALAVEQPRGKTKI